AVLLTSNKVLKIQYLIEILMLYAILRTRERSQASETKLEEDEEEFCAETFLAFLELICWKGQTREEEEEKNASVKQRRRIKIVRFQIREIIEEDQQQQ